MIFYGKMQIFRLGAYMKRKKIPAILALVVGLTALGGCTNSDQKVNIGNHWNVNAIDVNEAIHETLVYDVAFEANDTSLVEYQLNYKDGKYTTTLISEKVGSKTIYTYSTQLNITAQYTLNGVTEECNDVLTSTVKFYAAGDGLRPISSQKEINASTPTGITGLTASDCYAQSHYSIQITYNDDCTEGKSIVTNLDPSMSNTPAKEKTFEIDEKKFRFLDNEQVLLVLRAVNNSTSSAKLNVYSPFAEAIQKVSLSFQTEESAEFSFYKNGSEEKVKSIITYRPVNFVLDEKNPGGTQTAWVAKATDTSKNTNRNIILRLETPLSYGLGSLIYTLNSATYQ